MIGAGAWLQLRSLSGSGARRCEGADGALDRDYEEGANRLSRNVGGPLLRGTRASLSLTFAVLAVVLLASGCGGNTAKVPLAPPLSLPTFQADCATGSDGASRVIPVKVLSPSRFGALIVAGVCVNGKGPFPFLIDTGASTSAIDDKVAAALHLVDRTPREWTKSFGCLRPASFARVTTWSVGGTSLSSQPVIVAQLRSPVMPDLAGLLGSDVLSSFGVVRINYASQTLTLGTRRQQPQSDIARGTGAPTAPPDLTADASRVVPMPVKVLTYPFPPYQSGNDLSEVSPTVSVSIGARSYNLRWTPALETPS